MLVRIWATPGLSERLRQETASLSNASQPRKQFGIAEAPRLEIAVERLSGSYPMLKACYLECLRLYSPQTSILFLTNDLVIPEPRSERLPDGKARSFVMKAGELVAAIPSSNHHTIQTDEFKPDTLLNSIADDNDPQHLNVGTKNTQANQNFLYPRPPYLEREILALVAGILALWDFEPVDSASWMVPRRKQSLGVSLPSHDIRVRIRRRKLPPPS